MKWLELHLDTQPAGIEPATELLSEYGIDSLMIDEEGDFKDFLENNHQYWDYVDDELMEQMHGKSRITFYLEDSAEGYNTLAQFRIGLSAFKKQHPEYAPLILSTSISIPLPVLELCFVLAALLGARLIASNVALAADNDLFI